MGDTRSPDAPTDLGVRGRRFWRETLGRWELTDPERELLSEVCRRLDRLDVLRKLIETDGFMIFGSMGQKVLHPALAAERAEVALVAKVLGQLALPDEDGQALATPEVARARKAAQARWSRDPYIEARRARRGQAS